MDTNKTKSYLPGVGCDVTECVYNGTDAMCHADHIKVEQQASCCDSETDTFCGTFAPKQ